MSCWCCEILWHSGMISYCSCCNKTGHRLVPYITAMKASMAGLVCVCVCVSVYVFVCVCLKMTDLFQVVCVGGLRQTQNIPLLRSADPLRKYIPPFQSHPVIPEPTCHFRHSSICQCHFTAIVSGKTVHSYL
jgi:hypothetical protein